MAAENQVRYKVGGMDCASCATKIDTAVRRVPGGEGGSVAVAARTMTLPPDGTSDLGAIEKKVAGLGYSLRALGQKRPVEAGSARHEHGADGSHDHHSHDGEDAHRHDGGHDHAHHDRKEIEGLHGHDHGPMEGPW